MHNPLEESKLSIYDEDFNRSKMSFREPVI